ncbi:flagellar hook assembly protein FlgD [Thiocystis violacea]|uniref:flagellar hook assembly protein FlgD n=1 Tax=Thiocystis violacea TaxID=13725 RepID=UPI001907553E|nr:flagellar hook assembly protein FlgD [Thiocystis violacea]MBK1716738.1 flagellar hook capping protein [Thiocystis violacea]
MAELSTDYLGGLGLSGYGTTSATTGTGSKSSSANSEDLGQEDFLNLMITQLTNQDPTNPVDNEAFVAQMAQFSTLTGIQELTTSFEGLSKTLLQGQTLEAAALVGKDVLIPSSTAELSEGQGVSGAVDLSATAGQVKVDIYGAGGELVRTLDLGTLSAGLQEFEWDGFLDDGTAAPAGTYEFSVTAQTEGATEALTTLLDGQVKSVSVDSSSGGLMLNVQGMGTIGFSSVQRVG